MHESLTRSAARSLGVMLLAAAINTAIFVGMQALVGSREVRLADTRNFELANFIRVTETAPPVKSRRDPPPPKPSAEPRPEIEPLAGATRSSGSGPALARPAASTDLALAAVGAGGIGMNRVLLASELVPVVRASPEYPQSALLNGTEGYVDLLFTVDRTGSVTDLLVTAAEPSGMFEKATVEAARRWKFQPRLVEGRPVAVRVQTRVWFRLAEE